MENACTPQGVRAGGHHGIRNWLAGSLDRLGTCFAARQGAAELRALDWRELQDLGLDQGGIAYGARWGRDGR